MAKLVQRPTVEIEVAFLLTESEARALHALAGYRFEDFLRVFYEQLGKSYLEPYEDGLRNLFESTKDQLPQFLSRADAARKAFNKNN